MSEDFNPDIITVVDDQDVEHTFEMLDAIETDEARYVALLPVYDASTKVLDADGELVIMKVVMENTEEVLVTIDDDEEFDEIASIFEDRLQDLFEIEPIEQ